jgi:hypothetical protein
MARPEGETPEQLRERLMRSTISYAVTTASGKVHLTTKMYVEGRIGMVPRTLCEYLIADCSEPVLIEKPKEEANLCKRCREVYTDGIFDAEYMAKRIDEELL